MNIGRCSLPIGGAGAVEGAAVWRTISAIGDGSGRGIWTQGLFWSTINEEEGRSLIHDEGMGPRFET